MSISQRQK
jgi:hypothetical protein